MKFKSLAVAAVLAASSYAASAVAIFPAGPDDTTFIGNSYNVTTPVATTVYTFTTAVKAFFNGSLTTTDLTSKVFDFTAVDLNGIDLTSFVSPDGGTLPTLTLMAGNYTFTVTGNASGSKGGSWGGQLNLVAVPVPEPETYALLLAGLGAVGFIARRRSAN
jgi:hypothetical protein